jgi:hypothetical protein
MTSRGEAINLDVSDSTLTYFPLIFIEREELKRDFVMELATAQLNFAAAIVLLIYTIISIIFQLYQNTAAKNVINRFLPVFPDLILIFLQILACAMCIFGHLSWGVCLYGIIAIFGTILFLSKPDYATRTDILILILQYSTFVLAIPIYFIGRVIFVIKEIIK